jgi:hypothetical protein
MGKLLTILGALFCFVFAGCAPDYGFGGTKTVYIEIPTYIYEEIPEDPGLVWVDSFTQVTTVNGIDIIWIIDQSGSMSNDEDKVIAGIEAMINALPEAGWRLNMLSADPYGYTDAQFPLVPGATVDDAQAMYNAMAAGGREAGFSALQYYILYSSYASTWLRSDAALLVVFVSDEEEQSTSEFPNVSDFTTWYSSLRQNVYLSSIVNLDPNESTCNNTDNYTGKRYMEATNWYNGVIIDICSDDWSTGVRDATVQLDPYESIILSHTPVEDSIRVFANGQLYYDWHYDSSDNTVYFDVIPDAGVLVEVGYRYMSLDTGADTGKDTANT